MDGSAIATGFRMLVACFVVGFALAAGIMLLIESFTPKDHCVVCDREIHNGEKYCPSCGMRTDTLNTYNYWNRPKH